MLYNKRWFHRFTPTHSYITRRLIAFTCLARQVHLPYFTISVTIYMAYSTSSSTNTSTMAISKKRKAVDSSEANDKCSTTKSGRTNKYTSLAACLTVNVLMNRSGERRRQSKHPVMAARATRPRSYPCQGSSETRSTNWLYHKTMLCVYDPEDAARSGTNTIKPQQ